MTLQNLPPLTLLCLTMLTGACAAGELQRKALLGAQLAEAPDATPTRGGVRLERVIDDSAAAKAGLQPGDIVLRLGATQVTNVAAFLKVLAPLRAGDQLTVSFLRDGEANLVNARLRAMPRETGEGYEVLYGSVTNGDFRQRTIVTHPPGKGRHPAVLLLQGGHTCFPVDAPFGNPGAFVRIAQHLARNGYVTMRVERPGCGDSEGGPLREVDFDTELAGNLAALRALKQSAVVDADNVLIYGFSMGGIMAPLMATEEPVRGIATYGTTCITWFEGVVAQRRRLLLLKGLSPEQVNAKIPGHIRFWYQLAVERKTVREINDSNAVPDPLLKLWTQDARFVSGRHYRFYHQISARNLPAAWSRYAATPLPGSTADSVRHPRVLTMWGDADWHVTREESTDWIMRSVSETHPDIGTSVIVPESDHFSNRVHSTQESFNTLYGEPPRPQGEFNPAILSELLKWCDTTVGRVSDHQ